MGKCRRAALSLTVLAIAYACYMAGKTTRDSPGTVNPPIAWTKDELASHAAFGLHLRHVISRSSACVPDRMTVISVSNNFFASLTELQIATMPKCMLPRTAIYCSNSLLTSVSFHKHCFVAAEDLAASAYRQDQYMKIIWLKWRLITQATEIGNATLFIDADVVILRNPFPVLERISTPLAMQRESYGNPFAANKDSINGGVVMLRSHSLALTLEQLSTRGRELDQQTVQRYLDEQVVPQHTLLPTSFAGHCWARQWLPLLELQHVHLVAYHAHCVESPEDKLTTLQHVIHRANADKGGVWGREAQPKQASSQLVDKPGWITSVAAAVLALVAMVVVSRRGHSLVRMVTLARAEALGKLTHRRAPWPGLIYRGLPYNDASSAHEKRRCHTSFWTCTLVFAGMCVLAWLVWEVWVLPSSIAIVIRGNNIGNQMSRLSYAIYKRHAYGHHYLYIFCSSETPIHYCAPSTHMRTLRWSTADIHGECSSAVVRATSEFRFWSASYHPYAVAGVLKAHLGMPPPSPLLTEALVVHFRAGDAPFDRNPSYAFLRDAFYKRAVGMMGAPDASQVVILHCDATKHFDPPNKTRSLTMHEIEQLVPKYVEHMTALMHRVCPNARVTVQCSSIEEDFAAMLHARYFIGSTSSMSLFAAMLRGARPSAMPEPPTAWSNPSGTGHLVLPNATHLVSDAVSYLRSSSGTGYRLEQTEVTDYLDVKTVLKQLSQHVASEK